jgi:hypothetical protein
MKEYDLDSYCRKWRQTTGFFTTGKNELKQGTFTEFFEIERNILGVTIALPGKEQNFVLERAYDGYEMAKIEYHPVDSGWYPHREGVALLVRRHVRGFSQGLSNNNHSLSVYDAKGKEHDSWARFSHVDFLKRPTFEKLDPDKPFGVMNERIWWKDGMIFFLQRTIGCFKGTRVMLESRAFNPYIAPLLEEKCQIA